jgi:ATP-dependent helicase/nuclease subunit A
MTKTPKTSPIDLVTASAGTGKTFRLAEEIAAAVASGTPAECIVAVTFTTRAAEELIGRARARLIEKGHREAATSLLAGRVGTVNAVFGAFLREFAIAAGRSPLTDVIPEDRAQRIFRIAADQAIARHAPVLNPIARRFGYDERDGARPGTQSWQAMVQSICQLAQTNGIAPAALSDSALKSWTTLEACLEKPRKGESAAGLNAALLAEIDRALNTVGSGDGTQKTTEALSDLKSARRDLRNGTIAWSQWPKLTKLNAAKASNAALQPVRDAAAVHPRHPGLHEDLRDFITGVL